MFNENKKKQIEYFIWSLLGYFNILIKKPATDNDPKDLLGIATVSVTKIQILIKTPQFFIFTRLYKIFLVPNSICWIDLISVTILEVKYELLSRNKEKVIDNLQESYKCVEK